MKDNTNRIILILLAALVLLTVYRGRFINYTIPAAAVESGPGWRLSTEFEVYGDGDIGIYSHIAPQNECNRYDSLSIRLFSNIDTRIVYDPVMRSNKYEDTSKVSKQICPGDSVGFSEVFAVPDEDRDTLKVSFSWTDSSGNKSNTQIKIVRKSSFSLRYYENSTDILILLYPILWIAFGVLILAKLTKLIKD